MFLSLSLSLSPSLGFKNNSPFSPCSVRLSRHRNLRRFEEGFVGEEEEDEPARGGGQARGADRFHEMGRRAAGSDLELVQQHHRQHLE
jgi:hypothetical protein